MPAKDRNHPQSRPRCGSPPSSGELHVWRLYVVWKGDLEINVGVEVGVDVYWNDLSDIGEFGLGVF